MICDADTSPSQGNEQLQRVRDRVLLYVRGLDLPPATGVEFAAETLRTTPDPASYEKTMETLGDVLLSHGVDLHSNESLVTPLLVRHSMVTRPLDLYPWLTSIKRFFAGLFGGGRD